MKQKENVEKIWFSIIEQRIGHGKNDTMTISLCKNSRE